MVLALEREKPVGERGADTEHRLSDGSSSDACEPSDDDTAQGEVVGIIKRAERAIAAFMLSDGSSEKSSADVMMRYCHRSTATRHDAAPDDVIACALILESRFLVSLARWLAGARCGRTDGCLHRPVRSFVCPVTTVCQLVYGRTARLFHYSVLK